MTRSGADLTRVIGLPGGAAVTLGSTTVWEYPNLLGHTLVTGDGTTHGGVQVFDPFGQPLDMVTFAIGTAAADRAGLDATGAARWHQDARKPAEAESTVLLVEMGVRTYVPALGRFLQVDPVEGGVDNDYVWPTDPIGKDDVTGEFDWWLALDIATTAMMFIPGIGTATGLAIKSASLLARGAVFAYRSVKIASGISKAAYRAPKAIAFAARSKNYKVISKTFEKGTFGSPQSSFVYHYGKHGATVGKSPTRYLAQARASQAKLAGKAGYYRGSPGGRMSVGGKWVTFW